MPKQKSSKKKLIQRILLLPVVLFIIFGIITIPKLKSHIQYLDSLITEKFERNRWAIPARVYARPLEIFIGMPLDREAIADELQLAGYRLAPENGLQEGSYIPLKHGIEIKTRPFYFLDGFQEGTHCLVSFSRQGKVTEIVDKKTGELLDYLRFDPVTIASFLPDNFEDRILLNPTEIPDTFIRLLLAVEDKNFYSHHGVDPKGIARAVLQNIRAGTTVAGGSTLTQQLVKNHFLSNERTLKRKFNEMIMAILLEQKYPKQDILTAYCNEIFMGQDGKRAIHGFSLASEYYFKTSLQQLTTAQMALLIGMVKGPTYYHPVHHPHHAKKRRDIVLQVALQEAIITNSTYFSAQSEPLQLHLTALSPYWAYPSFIDLVQRRLLQNYDHDILTKDGLQIFTTLDPGMQKKAMSTFQNTMAAIEQKHSIGSLEGAFLITDRHTGELLAMSGGKKPCPGSFNRCLDAHRQIGSLIKPAVYLTAIENGYSLTSPLSDTRVHIRNSETGSEWRPDNYDGKQHGQILLYQGLEQSLNLATVRLGLQLGVPAVLDTVKKLGFKTTTPPYPSLLLGSLEMTPMEVLQMYQTLAADGFYTPVRAIRYVMDSRKNIVQSNGLRIEQRFAGEDIQLIQFALQKVVASGTARGLQRFIPPTFHIAAKTGTTNENRDSWFAGYSGDKVGVVWMGKDTPTETPLTGASGALVVWGNIFSSIGITPLKEQPSEKISYKMVPLDTCFFSDGQGAETIRIPYRVDREQSLHNAHRGQSIMHDLGTMIQSIIVFE